MKTLIQNIENFLKADITSGYISVGNIETNHVTRGLSDEEAILHMPTTKYPYIMIDDGGERTEDAQAKDTQLRVYSVVIEFAVFYTNLQTSIDNCLDLSTQIEDSIKAERNRQSIWTTPTQDDKYDDIIWGTTITPFAWQDDRYFFRGRRVIVEYTRFEFTYDRY